VQMLKLVVAVVCCRQVPDCLETDSGWIELRCAAEITPWPRSLRVWRDPLVWWSVCTVWFLGPHPASVGS